MMILPHHLQAFVRSIMAQVCVLMMLSIPARAQQSPGLHTLSIKPSYGVDMANPGGSDRNYLYGLHISYNRSLSTSTQPWVSLLNAKGLSFGVLWHNMNHMKETIDGKSYAHGTAIGLLSEIDFQLAKLGQTRLLFTPGVGLTYITETIGTQPATTTVGSHVNLALTAGLGFEI